MRASITLTNGTSFVVRARNEGLKFLAGKADTMGIAGSLPPLQAFLCPKIRSPQGERHRFR